MKIIEEQGHKTLLWELCEAPGAAGTPVDLPPTIFPHYTHFSHTRGSHLYNPTPVLLYPIIVSRKPEIIPLSPMVHDSGLKYLHKQSVFNH